MKKIEDHTATTLYHSMAAGAKVVDGIVYTVDDIRNLMRLAMAVQDIHNKRLHSQHVQQLAVKEAIKLSNEVLIGLRQSES